MHLDSLVHQDPLLRVTGTFGLLPMPDTAEEILREVSSKVTEDKH